MIVCNANRGERFRVGISARVEYEDSESVYPVSGVTNGDLGIIFQSYDELDVVYPCNILDVDRLFLCREGTLVPGEDVLRQGVSTD